MIWQRIESNTYNTPIKSPNNFNNYCLKSPIGKILVENYDPLPNVHQTDISGSSFQPGMSTPVETITTYKKALFMSEPSQKSIKGYIYFFYFFFSSISFKNKKSCIFHDVQIL